MTVDDLGEIVVFDYEGLDLPTEAFQFPFLRWLTYADIVEQAVDQIIKSKPDNDSGVAQAKIFIRELETVCASERQINVSGAGIVFCTPDSSKLIVRVSDNAIEINPADIDSPEIKTLPKGKRGILPPARELFSSNE